jgi:hypothetical protein
MHAAERLMQERGLVDRGWAAEASPTDFEDASPDSSAEPAEPMERQEGKEDKKPVLANVYSDLKRHTVSFLLDDTTANTVIYAVRLFAAESEAHAREVRMVGAALPPESYGAANRHVIASRHERVAARLRVLEGNYRKVVE